MYELEHSAKGSTWKNHKYTSIQMVNGKKRYIYGSPSTGFREKWESGNFAGTSKNRNAAIARRTGQGGSSSSKNFGKIRYTAYKTGLNVRTRKDDRTNAVTKAANSYKITQATDKALQKVKYASLGVQGVGSRTAYAASVNFVDSLVKRVRNRNVK